MPENCPCGLPQPYPACCGRFHAGQPASTAELLMRSRYSAFAVGDEPYLLDTWHPDTRPRSLRPDPRQQWVRLEVLDASGGGLFDADGEVEFRATYRVDAKDHVVAERSRFVREGGRWLYVGPR